MSIKRDMYEESIIYGEFEEWLNTLGEEYNEEDMKKFIRHKGYEPKGWDTEIPDYDDLMDILNENGWGTQYNHRNFTDADEDEDEDGYTIINKTLDERWILNNPFGFAKMTHHGNIAKTEWFVNGIRHRLGKPAVTFENMLTGELFPGKDQFWEYGELKN
jgi:hypothetical protein